MIPIDIQIHGYRKGHQLLSSSIELSREDQGIIDRLSDVSGPLRPREQFAPYLSAYPLPSGEYYVVAKTWQDLSVSRAGCVRTKSLLINAEFWPSQLQLINILDELGSAELPNEDEAILTELNEQNVKILPATPTFNASELVEALFLEESKPIVVFDAPDPEQIALHLITAMWPSLRRRFSFSTFALAPRRIGGRDFDLVFAPVTARAKFSDWAGRRIDGSGNQPERHRWTKIIVQRSFEQPIPQLLSQQDLMLFKDTDSDSAMSLRISLLWNELFGKLENTPTAALGLLDIATSGMVNQVEALSLLESPLVESIRTLEGSLSPIDSWEFVAAITQKMRKLHMEASHRAIQHLVEHLAQSSPDGVVKFLQRFDTEEVLCRFVPCIATGLGNTALVDLKPVLLNVSSDIFACLMIESNTLVSLVLEDDELIQKAAVALDDINQGLAHSFSKILLPLICEDRQVLIAKRIFCNLTSLEVNTQLGRIGKVNAFQASILSTLLIDRARELSELNSVRDTLIRYGTCDRTKDLLAMTLESTLIDALWLINETRLSNEFLLSQLVNMIQRANDTQFKYLLSNKLVYEYLLACSLSDAVDILIRATLDELFPIGVQIKVFLTLLPKLENSKRFELADCMLERCLRVRFDGDESAVLCMLLEVLASEIGGGRVFQLGVNKSIETEIVNRNLVIFETSPAGVRRYIVAAVGEMANSLQELADITLSKEAYDAAASLILDAKKVVTDKELIYIAGRLLPKLLRAQKRPVSLLIAALFPIVYEGLAKSNDATELMKVFFFFDWDKCKTARIELVDAFMWSSLWKAGDLALTACRCGDVYKILKQVYRSYDGSKYLARVNNDLMRLNDEDRELTRKCIEEIMKDKASNVSW